MSATISLTQTQIFTALVAVLGTMGLTSTSGAPVPIIRGQINRVPEPAGTDFVVLWPISRNRMAMNLDTLTDNAVTASVTNGTMAVTAVSTGSVVPGQIVWGAGLPNTGITILAQLSGTTGGIGTYSMAPSPNVTSGPLYCGTVAATMETEVTIQADVHGLPGATGMAADNVARIQTLFRDQFGVSAFTAQGVALAPLYTSDPRQIPFENAEQQTEERWTIDLTMQASVAITTPQQFADALKATAEAVSAAYPG
jgi:hypothetical protein